MFAGKKCHPNIHVEVSRRPRQCYDIDFRHHSILELYLELRCLCRYFSSQGHVATSVIVLSRMAISDNSGETTPSSRRSLSKNAACRRPQLVRSSATAPCLATSNACRSDLAHLHSSPRASALLNRVASYSSTRPGQSKSGTQSPQDVCRRNSSPSKRTTSSEKIGARDDLQKSMYSSKSMS